MTVLSQCLVSRWIFEARDVFFYFLLIHPPRHLIYISRHDTLSCHCSLRPCTHRNREEAFYKHLALTFEPVVTCEGPERGPEITAGRLRSPAHVMIHFFPCSGTVHTVPFKHLSCCELFRRKLRPGNHGRAFTKLLQLLEVLLCYIPLPNLSSI